MPLFKPSSTLSSATTNLTKSLIAKITIALVVMVILIPLFSLGTSIGLGKIRESYSTSITTHNQIEFLTRLRGDTVAYIGFFSNPPPENQVDLKFEELRSSFLDHVFPFPGLPTYLGSIEKHHYELINEYRAAALALQSGDRPAFNQGMQLCLQKSQSLLNEIDQILLERRQAVDAADIQADKTQVNISNLTLIFLVVALVISTLAIFFMVSTVVRPISGLNNRLTELLWTQTEHLTDRLNQLQSEIDHSNEILMATRHDLKAPLSNVKGLAELTTITNTNLPDEVRDNLEEIVRISDKGIDMVSSILARRQLRLNLEEVNLGELVDKVLRLVDLRFHNVMRQVEVAHAVIDPALMEHALLNLVSNARKFSQLGIGVGTRRSRKAGTVDEYEIEIWVWNDGALISAGDRQEIFKPGKQLEDGKKAGGHGLGLAIVKSIAERHHGRVVVDSHEKVGTTFRIFLPELSTAPDEPTQPSPEFQASNIESVLMIGKTTTEL